MPKLDRSYTHGYESRADGSVAFACSHDRDEWPWLQLPPRHPLVIQTQNFWTSVGASSATGSRDEDKWSALTATGWKLGNRAAGHASRGHFRKVEDADKLSFTTELFDADNRLICSITGEGVVFRTRDFESWREASKTKARTQATALSDFGFAARDKLGLSDTEPPLIAPLTQSGPDYRTSALVTRENGLRPGHPYFSGSGDHVNTPHLAEIARQVVSQLCDGAHVTISAGRMEMHRFIELGVPFEIEIETPSSRRAKMAMVQLGKPCATVSFEWD